MGRYRYVNKKFYKVHEVGHIIDRMNGNTLITFDSRKANIFGEYFSNVFTEDDGSLAEVKSRIEESVQLDSVDFSTDKVYKTLRRLNQVLPAVLMVFLMSYLKISLVQSVLRFRIFLIPRLVHTTCHLNGFRRMLLRFLRKEVCLILRTIVRFH